MSWFEDLTPYTYGHSKSTSPPTLNVGWLERGHEFPAGEVPAPFVVRLAHFEEHAPTPCNSPDAPLQSLLGERG